MALISAVTPACPVRTRLGVIGAGATAIVLLERILWHASRYRERRFEVVICEPNTPGVGVHDPAQPALLPLNTVAGQIGVLPGGAGGTLLEWLDANGLGDGIALSDYAPRRLCGSYLVAMFEQVCCSAPDNLSITLIRSRIETVVPQISGSGYLLKASDGSRALVDLLCLCEGHVGRLRPGPAAQPGVIEQCYPLPDSIADIAPGDTVGVEGMGLAASDVITMLTAGRGGRYEWRAGRYHYVPSGQEPSIWLHSRGGMPFRARPFAMEPFHRHQPLVLTRERIDRLREDRPRLDFATDIRPLLELEMSVAYHEARARLEGPEAAEALRKGLQARLRLDPSAWLARTELERLDGAQGAFDAQDAFAPAPPSAALGRYPEWVREFLVADLAEAELGLPRSPLKAALEVCRDLRDMLRHAVDFDGLTDASHADFYRIYAPMFNRLVGGPPIERNRELIAMLDAGIVRLPEGPVESAVPLASGGFRMQHRDPRLDLFRPVHVDWVIKAHGTSSGIIASASGPVKALHQAGRLTSVRSVPGLDGVRVDPLSRPIDADGRPVEDLALLGPVTEGARYYNHYLATSGKCRLRDDADRVAWRMIGAPWPVTDRNPRQRRI